ncbi:hypothetical protein IWZ00DRAFT_77098 [Phyllosticta capitalensis]
MPAAWPLVHYSSRAACLSESVASHLPHPSGWLHVAQCATATPSAPLHLPTPSTFKQNNNPTSPVDIITPSVPAPIATPKHQSPVDVSRIGRRPLQSPCNRFSRDTSKTCMLRPRRRRPAPTTSASSTGQTRRSAAIGASRCLPSSRSCSLSPFLWESSGTSRASTPDRRYFLPFWGLPTGLGATICSRNPHPAGPFDVLLRPASVSTGCLLACHPCLSCPFSCSTHVA